MDGERLHAPCFLVKPISVQSADIANNNGHLLNEVKLKLVDKCWIRGESWLFDCNQLILLHQACLVCNATDANWCCKRVVSVTLWCSSVAYRFSS